MIASASGALLLLQSSPAGAVDIPTVYDNSHNFPIGSRAAGMGGAYTALGCDEAALQYNPAALGCAGSSRIELAANAYILQGMSVPSAFGPGNDVDALNFHAIPSIVGGARVLEEGDPETAAGRWVFGISVAVPHSVVLKIEPSKARNRSSLNIEVIDNITTGDIGIGWQVHRVVAIGLSVGAALRTFDGSVGLLTSSGDTMPCNFNGQAGDCYEFYQERVDQEALAVGARAKLGVRLTPSRQLAFGLALSTPSLDLFGSSKLVDTTTFAITDGAGGTIYGPRPLRFSGSSDLSLPLRLALGAAYQTETVTLSFDASLNFPHTIASAYDFQQVEIEGLPALTADEVKDFETKLDRGWQPNFNVGAELPIFDGGVLALGAFTDISSVTAQAVAESNSDQLHMFGGTVALGLTGKQARGWFGISAEAGGASSKVLAGDLNLNNFFNTGLAFDGNSTITRYTIAGFIGSNYSFLSDEELPPPKPAELKRVENERPTEAMAPAEKPQPKETSANESAESVETVTPSETMEATDAEPDDAAAPPLTPAEGDGQPVVDQPLEAPR